MFMFVLIVNLGRSSRDNINENESGKSDFKFISLQNRDTHKYERKMGTHEVVLDTGLKLGLIRA